MNDKSGSAFPSVHELSTELAGLTKRELFAAMAMQGMMGVEPVPLGSMVTWNPMYRERIAQGAVLYADALLAELERGDG